MVLHDAHFQLANNMELKGCIKPKVHCPKWPKKSKWNLFTEQKLVLQLLRLQLLHFLAFKSVVSNYIAMQIQFKHTIIDKIWNLSRICWINLNIVRSLHYLVGHGKTYWCRSTQLMIQFEKTVKVVCPYFYFFKTIASKPGSTLTYCLQLISLSVTWLLPDQIFSFRHLLN